MTALTRFNKYAQAPTAQPCRAVEPVYVAIIAWEVVSPLEKGMTLCLVLSTPSGRPLTLT